MDILVQCKKDNSNNMFKVLQRSVNDIQRSTIDVHDSTVQKGKKKKRQNGMCKY